jgi:hypothetical protein
MEESSHRQRAIEAVIRLDLAEMEGDTSLDNAQRQWPYWYAERQQDIRRVIEAALPYLRQEWEGE